MFGEEQYGRRDFHGENAVFLRAEEVYSINSMVIERFHYCADFNFISGWMLLFFYFQQQHLFVPQK